MTVQELLDKVKKHDLFFDFSDDRSVWKRGKAELDEIIAGIKELRMIDPDLKTKVRVARGTLDEITAANIEGWFAKGI